MKFNSIPVLATLLAVTVCGRAAADGVPATSNVGNAECPHIASDLRVTFRLKVPNAKQVKLEGGAGLAKEPQGICVTVIPIDLQPAPCDGRAKTNDLLSSWFEVIPVAF